MVIFSEVSLDGLILTANQAILAAAVTKHSEKNRRKMTSRRMRPRPCFLFGRFFCLKDWDMNINLCHELAKPVESSLLFDFNKPIRHKDSMWKTNHPKTFLFFFWCTTTCRMSFYLEAAILKLTPKATSTRNSRDCEVFRNIQSLYSCSSYCVFSFSLDSFLFCLWCQEDYSASA